jgi:hypothetical protein
LRRRLLSDRHFGGDTTILRIFGIGIGAEENPFNVVA